MVISLLASGTDALSFFTWTFRATEARKQLPFQRYIRRSMDQDLFEEVQARMRDPTFRHQLSERMWKCEGLFAEAKQNHGLARARYRGRGKVQIQAYLLRSLTPPQLSDSPLKTQVGAIEAG
jgi:hypothetical protein